MHTNIGSACYESKQTDEGQLLDEAGVVQNIQEEQVGRAYQAGGDAKGRLAARQMHAGSADRK